MENAYVHVVPHRTDPGEGHPVTLFRLDAAVDESEFLRDLVLRIVGSVEVRGRDGTDRPASFRDVAVLYRSDASGEVLSGYGRALAAGGIPYVVPSRKGFFLRQEIQDLRMVLSAVDVPSDRSARHAGLKTLFFGLSDEEILPLYGDDPSGVPDRTRDALALLARLSARRERASLPDLLAELYRETAGRETGFGRSDSCVAESSGSEMMRGMRRRLFPGCLGGPTSEVVAQNMTRC